MNAISSGFGEYALPLNKTFPQFQSAEKIKKIAAAAFLSLLAILSCFLPLPLALPAVALFSVLAIRASLSAAAVFNRAPPTQSLFPPDALAGLPALGETSPKPCSGFPAVDGPDAHRWKLELIRAAQRSIVYSGCYCGGKPFQELLDLVQERLHALPGLTFTMTCSPTYLTSSDKKRIAALSREFGPRFDCVYTPEVFATRQGSLSCQHTKALVIDYGAYFLTGGTGAVSCWTEQTGAAPPKSRIEYSNLFIHLAGSHAFRDTDFVFRSDFGGVGTRLYVELSKLIERMRYRNDKTIRIPSPPQNLPTAIPHFDNAPQKSDALLPALYASGPEQKGNLFHDEVVRRIETAETSIYIDHMYFHPTPQMLAALNAASCRGVAITLVTNGLSLFSPLLHFGYAELSRKAASRLVSADVYEYAVPRSTLHKKAIVIDSRITFLGSSNLGRKSLDSTDYEINLKVDSPAFAASTLASIQSDLLLCRKIPRPQTLPLRTRLLAPIQSLCIPIL